MTLLATSFTAVYSLRVVFFVSMGNPRFNSLSPVNENNPAVINPIKRLAWGSILAGLLLTSSITPLKTPVMSIPPLLKLAALIVSILGLIIALELASLTTKQFKPAPLITPHHFSNMLGFFPIVAHRLAPKLTLTLGQAVASQIVDQTWLEKAGPKAIASSSIPLITTTSNAQKGKIKTYLTQFLLTLTIAVIMLAF